MKRLFSYFAAFATMFAIASCQEEIAQPDMPVDGDSKTVTFSVEAPTLPQTKAFGDGTQDLKLLCAVYVGEGNKNDKPVGTFLGGKREADDDFLLTDGVAPQIVRGTTDDKVKWDVTITLVKYFNYDIVFWAQTEDAPYEFDEQNAKITTSYNTNANDESRDAFYLCCKKYNVMNPNDSKIELVRPFAQINLGAADYDALTYLGIKDLTSAISSKATATVPNILNLLDGTVDGAVEVSFEKTAAPVGEVTANNIVIGTGADAKTFRLVGMNYILADDKTTVDLAMNFNYNGKDLNIDVPSVPYARNYKTNIVGNFFTDDAEFEVVIAPMFEEEDEIYNTDLTLAEAFEVDRDVTLVLKEDQVISEPLILENGKTLTLNLDEYSITTETDLWDAAKKVWSMISVRNGSTLVINSKGGKVVAKANDAYAIDVQDGSTVTINGGEFVGNISAVYVLDGTANINGGSYSIQQLSEPANGSDERFTLNCEDAAYKAGEAVINVTGGSFVNFNPSNNLAEGQGTNFLADGYKVNIEDKDEKKYYTVVELNPIEKAVAEGANTVVLSEDLELDETIAVASELTIDLGGKALSTETTPAFLANANLTIKNGTANVAKELVRVGAGVTVTLDDVTATSEGDNCIFVPKESKDATVVVAEGTALTSKGAAAIQSNGNTEGLDLTIAGTVVSEGDVAVYLPQVEKCTVASTAKISGVTGIEIRAGELVVEDGAEISATVNTLTANANGNGSTVIGAAIAVSPHTTDLPIDVTINGGEFGCAYSLYEKNLQDEDRTAATTLAVTGGTFNAPIFSDNCEDFITGGTFAEGVEVPETYIPDNYAIKDGVISKMYTTVADFLAAAEDETEDAPVYTLSGTITGFYLNEENAKKYGNFYLKDDTGEVLIYGLYSPEGEKQYWAASGAKIGDDIVVKTVRTSYSGTPQGKNAIFVELVSPGTRAFLASTDQVSFTAEGGQKSIPVYNATECTAESNNDQFMVEYSDGKLIITAKENKTEEVIEGSISVTLGNTSVVIKVSQAGAPSANGGGRADLETLTNSTSYTTSTTTAGWIGTNCAVLEGGDNNSSPKFICIGKFNDTYAKALCMNGKTSAVGTIESPNISGGCGSLSFNYAYVFKDTTPASFKVEIFQNGNVVKTFKVESVTAVQYEVKSETLEINVSGDFMVKFTNLSPSNYNSNRDRTAVWNIEWTGYSDK